MSHHGISRFLSKRDKNHSGRQHGKEKVHTLHLCSDCVASIHLHKGIWFSYRIGHMLHNSNSQTVLYQFFNRARTQRPQFDKFSTDADIGAYQTGSEKVENEAGFTPTADLYGLFSSPGKAAASHEEQKVGDKFKCHVGALPSLRIPIRSKSFVDG